MDIPGAPPKATLQPTGTAPRSTTTPVALETLGLQQGSTYQATVIGPAKATDNVPTTNLTDKVVQEYLVQLQGKAILVSSSKTLKTQQHLLVQLNQTTPPQLQVVATAPATDQINSPKLSAPQVDTLLRALTPLMAKQSSLSQTIQQLNIWLTSDSPIPTQTQALARAFQKVLQQHALQLNNASSNTASSKVDDGSMSNPLRAPSNVSLAGHKTEGKTGQTLPAIAVAQNALNLLPQIRQQLLNGGNFFEQNLSLVLTNQTGKAAPGQHYSATQTPPASTPQDTQTQQAKILTLAQQLLSPSAKPAGESPAGTNNPAGTHTATAGASATTSQNSTGMSNAAQALQAMQQLLSGHNSPAMRELLNTLLQPANGGASTSPPQSTTQVLTSDLKGQIMQLLGALQSERAPLQPGAKLPAFAQVDLLKAPFDFPHPGSSNMSKAAAVLSEEPLSTGQLLRLMASMLNRLQFNQLNSLYQSHTASSDGTLQQSWFFELPILSEQQNMQALSLRVDRREDETQTKHNDSRKQAIQWQLTLSFDLDLLGPLYVQLKLCPPRVSSVVWADKPSTFALIQKERELLRHNLSALGLEVEDIQCQQGWPKQDRTQLQHQLVDIKA